MKKVLLVLAAVLMCGFASATTISNNDWKFEPTVGPVIGIHNWGNQFGMNFKIGKGDNLSGLFGVAFGGLNNAQIKLGASYDFPFYFTFSKANDFSVGPTVDAGIRFGFGKITAIDFFNLGFGCRTSYQITNTFGVVADLAHFSTSFVGWVKGNGVDANFAMAYDMQFGVFLLF